MLEAVSLSWRISFVARHKFTAFVVLGAVVLAVTGAEALYADMSHFGRKSIRGTWTYFVLPCLLLNYFGQGALVIANPAATNPLYEIAPQFRQIPLIILSTTATIIACQAVISGAFTISRQCVQLGLFPRMEIRHTNVTEEGQIYVPQINALFAFGVVTLVIIFKTSDALAWASGIAVTGTFLCTNILAVVVFRSQFHWSRAAAPSIYKVTLSFGFTESPNNPRELQNLTGVRFDPMETSYFLGRETVVPASIPKLNFIRRWLFLSMARSAVSATEFFQIPSDRVIELGMRIAI